MYIVMYVHVRVMITCCMLCYAILYLVQKLAKREDTQNRKFILLHYAVYSEPFCVRCKERACPPSPLSLSLFHSLSLPPSLSLSLSPVHSPAGESAQVFEDPAYEEVEVSKKKAQKKKKKEPKPVAVPTTKQVVSSHYSDSNHHCPPQRCVEQCLLLAYLATAPVYKPRQVSYSTHRDCFLVAVFSLIVRFQ